MPKKGLYANIHAKKKRIKAGSGEKMRKPGSKGAPTAAAFKKAAKTAKNVLKGVKMAKSAAMSRCLGYISSVRKGKKKKSSKKSTKTKKK